MKNKDETESKRKNSEIKLVQIPVRKTGILKLPRNFFLEVGQAEEDKRKLEQEIQWKMQEAWEISQTTTGTNTGEFDTGSVSVDGDSDSTQVIGLNEFVRPLG